MKGYLMIVGAAALWGVSATAAKLLLNQHLNTILIVQTRVSVSFLLMGAFFLLFRRQLLRARVADMWRFAVMGVLGIAGANFTYYFTIKESTVATAIMLQYTAPVFVLVYTALTGEERLSRVKVLAALVALGGCFLAIGGYDTSVFRVSEAGLLSGFGAMATYSFMAVYTRRLLHRYGVWQMTVYSLGFASVFWLIVNPPGMVVEQSPSMDGWVGLFALAIISVLIPHSLYFAGLQHVPASRAMIMSTLEPVIAILTAAAILGELLQPLQVGGAMCVLGAILLLQSGENTPSDRERARDT
jgi:drug/metabolite transporter (DMT)-like permease